VATGINNRGWIVGSSEFVNTTGYSHAVLWRNGRIFDLGSLAGPTGFSSGSAINSRGEIVGYSSTVEGEYHAFLWRGRRMIDLGTLGGTFAMATAINDRGEIVGYSSTVEGEYHAFLWRGRRMIDLGTAEGWFFGQASGINNRGLIVGDSGGPVVWRRGGPTLLPLIPGRIRGAATGVNDRGDIVGYQGFATGHAIQRATIWRHGVPTELGFEDGVSVARDINNKGQIVGWKESVPWVSWGAFLWQRGRVTDLPSLTGVAGSAYAINDRGEIVGDSPIPDDSFGYTHAVRWRVTDAA
jgi:probable HAF family extracellular repeat protein